MYYSSVMKPKKKVHDVLVEINMGRKEAASSGGTTIEGHLREVRCI